MARLVRTAPGEVGRGIGRGISGTSTSGVGLSTLGIKRGVEVVCDWIERPMVDGRFLLQGRGMAGIGSLASWRRDRSCGSSEEIRGLFPEPAGAGCERLGWLNFLNKREKDIGSVQRVRDQGDR